MGRGGLLFLLVKLHGISCPELEIEIVIFFLCQRSNVFFVSYLDFRLVACRKLQR